MSTWSTSTSSRPSPRRMPELHLRHLRRRARTASHPHKGYVTHHIAAEHLQRRRRRRLPLRPAADGRRGAQLHRDDRASPRPASTTRSSQCRRRHRRARELAMTAMMHAHLHRPLREQGRRGHRRGPRHRPRRGRAPGRGRRPGGRWSTAPTWSRGRGGSRGRRLPVDRRSRRPGRLCRVRRVDGAALERFGRHRHPDQQRRRHDLGQALRALRPGARSRPKSVARCSRRCGAAVRCCRAWSSSGAARSSTSRRSPPAASTACPTAAAKGGVNALTASPGLGSRRPRHPRRRHRAGRHRGAAAAHPAQCRGATAPRQKRLVPGRSSTRRSRRA